MAKDTIAKLVKEKGKQKPGGKRGTNTIIDRSGPEPPYGTRVRQLTPRQMSVIDFYFSNNFNKAEAFRSAGMSDKTSTQFWGKFQVRKEVNKRLKALERDRKKIITKFNITQENIVKELAKLAFAPLPGDILYDEGSGILIEECEVEGLGSLAPVDAKDKKAALDSLAKIQGMFTDRVKIEGDFNLIDLITEGRKRLAITDGSEKEDEEP